MSGLTGFIRMLTFGMADYGNSRWGVDRRLRERPRCCRWSLSDCRNRRLSKSRACNTRPFGRSHFGNSLWRWYRTGGVAEIGVSTIVRRRDGCIRLAPSQRTSTSRRWRLLSNSDRPCRLLGYMRYWGKGYEYIGWWGDRLCCMVDEVIRFPMK